jgi:hypothetical protein
MTTRQFFSMLFLLSFSVCNSQIIKDTVSMNIYLFPGQGSDQRLFDSLHFKEYYNLIPIIYSLPDRNISMRDYALLLSQQIDTNSPFVLIGVSLGGMICSELTQCLHPEKVIIISSAKCRNELPTRYKFMKFIPIYKIFPAGVLKSGAFVVQPIFEPDRSNNKETFKAMLHSKDPRFIKRTLDMIVNWDLQEHSEKIVHIHGNNDHTLPYKKVKADYLVENGSHMMTLTQGKDISNLLNQILK